MRILITGGTGLIGRALTPQLLERGYQVTLVTRDKNRMARPLDPGVEVWNGLDLQQNLDDFTAVINLAGEPIARRRWSESQKRLLCESRWQITQRLVDLIKASSRPPSVLISGSAIGYYGNLGDTLVSETEPPHQEFTHHLCARWEEIACQAQSETTRVCLLRTGAVLAASGGMLAKLLPIFRTGLGGPIGNGHQYLSWIHIDDMTNGILWLLEHALEGPFNMVSPYPVRNQQFSHILGQVMNKPVLFRTPGWVVRMLLGEAAILLLGGQRALPQRLESSGFQFNFASLEKALQEIIKSP